MWLCLSDAFYSIVAHQSRPGALLVRARRPGDIERLLPGARVEVTPQADYSYRTLAPAQTVAEALGQVVRAIDYPNFKASVQDPDLSCVYGRVWHTLAELQR
jgi:hypothetical protein